MRYKFVSVLLAVILSVGAITAAQDCPALVERALSRAERACAGMRTSQACYGYQTLEAQLVEGLSPFAFNGVGDITGVETIRSLRLSALNPATNEWGVSVMRVRADISEAYPNENVTLLAFGDVTLDPAESDEYQPMQAFAFRTGDASSGCTDITENGLLIQTPEGVGKVTLWINDVRVRIGSTVLFEATAEEGLTVSTFEGLAEVEAQGQMQAASAGMRVRVPLDEEMRPAAPPSEPEAFDAQLTALMPLVDTVTAFTDGSVRALFEDGTPGQGVGNGRDGDSSGGIGGGSDQTRQGNCNRDHGQGEGAGNCYGHNNPNNPNNPDNGGGNNGNNGNNNGNGRGKGN